MNKKILLIDDEPELRESLTEFLENEGFSVTQAANGKVALEILKTGAMPNLILLDYMMPVMDGKTFCQEFNKEEKWFGQIPVVLLTAARVEQDLIASMKLTAKLSKPIAIPQFLDVVKKYCPKI